MKTNPTISDAEITLMMHRAGMRPSVQRIAILSHIGNARTHPSAEEIYNVLKPSMPSLSRTTVYNTLHSLTENRLARVVEIETGLARYDLSAFEPHAHFRCVCCGKIMDVEMNLGEIRLPEGCTLESADVFYKGYCKECGERTRNADC